MEFAFQDPVGAWAIDNNGVLRQGPPREYVLMHHTGDLQREQLIDIEISYFFHGQIGDPVTLADCAEAI